MSNIKKKIVVIGSSNTDMVIKSDHFPKPGETVLGGEFLMNPGGKGANQAVAATRLGGDVSFICKVGNDMFGKEAIAKYNEDHINIEHVSVSSEQPSGVALINIDQKGENCISVASGANYCLSEEDINRAEPIIKNAAVVLLQLEIPILTVTYAARMAKQYGAIVVLNPAPAPKEALPSELLSNVDVIIPNSTEMETITKRCVADLKSAQDAIGEIISKGVKTVIVTLGSKGTIVFHDGKYKQIPAYSVEAVDTTAAGDTFCGGVCVALAEGKTVFEAVQFGTKAASICVTRMGAQGSIPFRNEIGNTFV